MKTLMLLLVAVSFAPQAHAASEEAANTAWLVLASVLVFFMQAGFGTLAWMIATHAVYGIVLGSVYGRLVERARRDCDPRKHSRIRHFALAFANQEKSYIRRANRAAHIASAVATRPARGLSPPPEHHRIQNPLRRPSTGCPRCRPLAPNRDRGRVTSWRSGGRYEPPPFGRGGGGCFAHPPPSLQPRRHASRFTVC